MDGIFLWQRLAGGGCTIRGGFGKSYSNPLTWSDHPDHHHHHCHHQQCDHQQVAGKTMDNFAKVISIQVRTCFCEESQLFWRSFTNICVEPISGRQRGKGNFQLNDFGNCSAAECRRRRKMVATYRNIIKSWPDLPSIMRMIMMMIKNVDDKNCWHSWY